jgi:hypothetical protein
MTNDEKGFPRAEDRPPAVTPPGAGDDGRPSDHGDQPEDMGPRLERLGGEPAPDITPEEFARLQQAGQIHIDPRGRVRTTARDELDAGVSLRKRRAWYRA